MAASTNKTRTIPGWQKRTTLAAEAEDVGHASDGRRSVGWAAYLSKNEIVVDPRRCGNHERQPQQGDRGDKTTDEASHLSPSFDVRQLQHRRHEVGHREYLDGCGDPEPNAGPDDCTARRPETRASRRQQREAVIRLVRARSATST
jgi:hypothetical protein